MSTKPQYNESNNLITGSEQLLTLWKKNNNLINSQPYQFSNQEKMFYNKNLFSNSILNKNIPNSIINPTYNSSDFSILVTNLDGTTTTISFLRSQQYITIETLETAFSSYNILPGAKCLIPGYNYLEFYYQYECYPTSTTTNNPQDYYNTWFIPNIINSTDFEMLKTNTSQINLLQNTIPRLYDSLISRLTYNYKIYISDSNGITYNQDEFSSFPFFAYILEETGILQFFGGDRDQNSVELNYITGNKKIKNEDGFRPRLSYIRYVGPTGFDNLEMSGNIVVDGSLNINGNLNISGGNIFIDGNQVNSGGNVNGVSDWDDLSLSNLDLSGNLRFKVSDTSYVTLKAPSDLSASYTLKLPKAQGTSGDILALDSSQQLIFTNQNGNGNSQNFLNNIQSKTLFSSDISHLVIDSSLHDLSNIFSHTITPSKTNAKIFVDFNFLYKCSYAFEERITIKIYRDNCDNYIQSDQNLGSRNFTGGLIGKYSGSFIDTLNNTSLSQVKYYITFQLEKNNSEELQGIYKFNSITLIEY
jgi:hypothetical protein